MCWNLPDSVSTCCSCDAIMRFGLLPPYSVNYARSRRLGQASSIVARRTYRVAAGLSLSLFGWSAVSCLAELTRVFTKPDTE